MKPKLARAAEMELHMQEIVTCPECRRRLQVPMEAMGQRVQCPSCEFTFFANHAGPPVEALPPPISTGAVQTNAPETKSIPIDVIPPVDDQSTLPAPSVNKYKRFRPIPVPSQPNPAKRFLIIGAVIVCTVAGVVCIATFGTNSVGHGRHDRPMPVPFANGPRIAAPKLDAAAQKAIAKAVLDRLGNAVRNGNLVDSAACFDGWRTIDDLAEQNIMPGDLRQHPNLPQDIASWFCGYFKDTAVFWGDFVVAHVKQLDKGDIVVISRHRLRGEMGQIVRFRWFMTFHQNQWRIYECEEADYGFRVSLSFDPCLTPVEPTLANDLRTMRDAFNKMIAAPHNFDDADKKLDGVKPANQPPSIRATYHLLRAQACNRLTRDQAAVDHCDEALRLNPDLFGADYIKSLSCTWLNLNDVALEHAKKFHAILGDDSDACYVMGLAMQRLFRRAEAAAFYRKSLDDDPKHFDSFLNLLNCLNARSPNRDLGERFLDGQKPREKFQQCAETLWRVRNSTALIALAEAIQRIEPMHADAPFYSSLAELNQGKADAAFRLFNIAWKRQAQPERREHYLREFSQAAAQAQESVRAYAGLPVSANAFRHLARELQILYRIDELRELIAQHAKKKSKDPYLRLYQAEVFFADANYLEAKTAYTEAFNQINDLAELEAFRHNRINVLFKLGEAMHAYAEIAPKEQTFLSLAQLCWHAKQFDVLEKLVREHEKDHARDPQFPRWNWRVALVRKQYERLGAIVKQAFEMQHERHVIQDFAFDAVEAGQALEAYKHLPNPSVDVEFIAAELAMHQRPKELRELIELHRKRFPQDRLLGGLDGQAAMLESDWKSAAAAYAKAWSQLPDDKKLRWRTHYLQSHHKIGKSVDAYRDLGLQQNDFRRLATMLLNEKNIDGFEKLLEAHRPQRAKDPEFDLYDSRWKILRNKADEAVPLMTQAWKQLKHTDRRNALSSFVNDMLANGKAEDAYRCSPDRVMAFQQMSWQLRQAKKIGQFETLLKQHAVDHPKDERLIIEQAELALLQKNPAKAEVLLADLRTRENDIDGFTLHNPWLRARIAGGKVEQTYRELGASQRTFLELANEYSIAKNGEQLEVLLRIHREAFPNASKYDTWDIEVLWLKKDYIGTIREIRAKRATLLKGNQRWKLERWLVRSCVYTKKFADAVTEAEIITKESAGAKNLLVLALASTGDVQRTLAYVEKNASSRYFVEDLYRDEDLGPMLRSDAFRAFRERYPEPPANLNDFGFDDDDDLR